MAAAAGLITVSGCGMDHVNAAVFGNTPAPDEDIKALAWHYELCFTDVGTNESLMRT